MLAVLYGYLGTNVGDVAVTIGALQMLQKAGLRVPITVVAPPLSKAARISWAQIEDAMPGVRLIEFDFRHRRASLAAIGIAEAEVIVYPGGEHLFSYDHSQDNAFQSRLDAFLDAARHGKRIIVLPSTFGPLGTDLSRELTARLIDSASVVLARDRISAEVIKDTLGRNVGLGLDPAFFLDEKTAPFPQEKTINIVMRLDGAGLRVGAIASKVVIERHEKSRYETSAAFQCYREAALQLIDEGFLVRILVQVEADAAPGRALHDAIERHRPGRSTLLRPGTVRDFISALAGGDLTITCRFHSAIFSILAGRTPVGVYFVEHGHKLPGLFSALGHTDLCFEKPDAEQIVRACIASFSERQETTDNLAQAVARLRERTLSAIAPHLPEPQVCSSRPATVSAEEVREFERTSIPKRTRPKTSMKRGLAGLRERMVRSIRKRLS